MAAQFMRRLRRADTRRGFVQIADGIAVAIGHNGIAPLLREEFTLSRAEIATEAGRYDVLRTRRRRSTEAR
jgi:hypothetical protein